MTNESKAVQILRGVAPELQQAAGGLRGCLFVGADADRIAAVLQTLDRCALVLQRTAAAMEKQNSGSGDETPTDGTT